MNQKTLAPKIKAIPTRYKGALMRSRLEAKWAAFFDSLGWKWDYEPIDFDGWAPDFVIRTPLCPVYVEVKPVELWDAGHCGPLLVLARTSPDFDKAMRHWNNVQVLLLGVAPQSEKYSGIGSLLDQPESASYPWLKLHEFFEVEDAEQRWREAASLIQWAPG